MARNNSSPVQQFRGTTAQHNTYTGLPGELTVDTDKHVVVVHDGSTAGGHPMVPDKFLLKSAGGILTFDAGAEAPLQGDSVEVEINLTALEEALGGALTECLACTAMSHQGSAATRAKATQRSFSRPLQPSGNVGRASLTCPA